MARPKPLHTSPNEIATRHIGIVYPMAASVYRKLGKSIALDDLIANGFQGLVEASQRYDRDRGQTVPQLCRRTNPRRDV